MDPADALVEINARHGTDWTIVTSLEGGYQSGAWRVDGPTAGEGVLKMTPEWWAPRVLGAAPIVQGLVDGGYPTPRWLAWGSLAHGDAYQVQAFAAGKAASALTPAVAATWTSLVEQHRGAGQPAHVSWSDYIVTSINRDGDRVREIGAISRAVERVLTDTLDLVDRYPLAGPMPEHDLVHGDLNLSNVLLDDRGAVTAVIDIEAVGRGTRAYDLLTPARQQHLWAMVDPPPATALDACDLLHRAAFEAAPSAVVVRCAASQVLDLLTWGRDRWDAIDVAADGLRLWLSRLLP